MSASESIKTPHRTAVLVVHGIGSQRAQETVRGVLRAAWLDSDDKSGKRVWTHPEKSGTDLDLLVMTTSGVPEARDHRQVDFHELYWAHLMSETKAVAVLLWLFELARRGPNLKPGMNGGWWFAAIFLCLLILSTAQLTLQGIFKFSNLAPYEALTVVIAPFLIIFSGVVLGLFVSLRHRAFRLARLFGLVCIGCIVLTLAYFAAEAWAPNVPDTLASYALPVLVAFLATYFLMGRHGLRAFLIVLIASFFTFAAVFVVIWYNHPEASLERILRAGWRPWSLDSSWSAGAAWIVIGVYLVINAVFLQPYLGDAARYFRNSPANVAVRREIRRLAVDTLAALHSSGLYDRIIIVAHSLGSVISYDMLRAYFSQMCDQLPPPEMLGRAVDEVDQASWQPFEPATEQERNELRTKSREIVSTIAKVTRDETATRSHKSWLVTDFITLGNALTHAHYLMCTGGNRDELARDFRRRVDERDFPSAPPQKVDRDGLLLFTNPRTGMREFHHGAVFGLTRWTNLYFPLSELFWGDAIGGPVAPLFGSHVRDIAVSTNAQNRAGFFTHTAYWKVTSSDAPHILALRDALNLADR